MRAQGMNIGECSSLRGWGFSGSSGGEVFEELG